MSKNINTEEKKINLVDRRIMSAKGILVLKIMLWVSGMAFLLLVNSGTKMALYGCLGLSVLWGAFLYKSMITWKSVEMLLRHRYILYLSIFFCIGLGCNFYAAWRSNGIAEIVANRIGIDVEKLILLCAIAGVVAAIPVVTWGLLWLITTALENVKKANISSKQEKKISAKKAFVITTVIYTLGISAILRANINYIDDQGRVAWGEKAWENYSRFLSNLFSTFIHMDNYLTDVSPLTQMIAVMIIAFSGIMLLYIIYDRTYFSTVELIALVPLGLNPYFLQCVSYKYDSPYMALSILGAVMPLLYRNRRAVAYIGASAIGTIVVCTSYQAASGIFPMLVIFLSLKMWNSKESWREIGRFCLNSVIGYLSGLLFFRMILMIPTEAGSLLSIEEIVPGMFANIKKYYMYVCSDFKEWWLIVILVLAAGFVWITVRTSRQKKLVSFCVAIAALILMSLICFGVYPVLEEPSYAPRAMYGVGVLITLLEISVAYGRKDIMFQVQAGLMSWIFFVFAFTYGNALYVQKEYCDFRINMAIGDLNDLNVFMEEAVTVQISGSIEKSQVIDHMPQDYNLINRLVPVQFKGEWWWGQASFYEFYGLRNVIRDPGIDLTTYDLPVLEDTMYHTIKGKDNYILIELK
ncbi:MAG: glucosyltransferase domain-containing protein [Lachnospiraceae bacterium]|nr:glucosyltransferase domain-containing protein [Lachnospiraceae bacterium]